MTLYTLSCIAAFSPLVGAILAGFLGWKLGRTFSHSVTIASVAISFAASVGALFQVWDGARLDAEVYTWLAGEGWKLHAYRQYDATGDSTFEPYCVMASQAVRRTVTPDDAAGREFGKVYDLAFGFGGGLVAWRKFDPSDTYSDSEIEQFKTAFRDSHPATKQFWHELERAAHACVFTRRRIELGRLSFEMQNGTLLLTLPNDRKLPYPEARLMPGKFEGTRELQYKDNARGGWTDFGAWYGTLVENATQAVARDVLANAVLRLEAAGYPVVLHVHDEIVCEVPEGFGSIEEFHRLLTVVPDWAEGLPIAAKAWTRKRYAKSKAATTSAAPAAINGTALDTPAAQTKIEVTPSPVVEDNDKDDDGPS